DPGRTLPIAPDHQLVRLGEPCRRLEIRIGAGGPPEQLAVGPCIATAASRLEPDRRLARPMITVTAVPGELRTRCGHRSRACNLASRQCELQGLIEQRIDAWIAAPCTYDSQHRERRNALRGGERAVLDELIRHPCGLVPVAAIELAISSVRPVVGETVLHFMRLAVVDAGREITLGELGPALR